MSTTTIVLGIILLGFALLMYRSWARLKNSPLVENNQRIITLTDIDFFEQIGDKIILVDFWAAWCAPCRMMAPVLNELADELPDNLFIGKMDIEQNKNIAQKFSIRSIPTFILFKNGVEVKRFMGVKSKAFLLKEMQSVS